MADQGFHIYFPRSGPAVGCWVVQKYINPKAWSRTVQYFENKIEKGGKVLASGGYGCVFTPALKCEGAKKRETGKISKLMTMATRNLSE